LIEVYNIGELKDLTAWLEQYVKPRLGSDVSGYARGRRRAWLGIEPALTDSYKAKPGVPIEPVIHERLVQLISWDFDYCLVTYSDVQAIGITPHRDAKYADYEARGLNVSGTCKFDYWCGRQGFGRSPNTREFNPKVDPPTHSYQLTPGSVVRFNCKNLHAAIPSACRWNINFWRAAVK